MTRRREGTASSETRCCAAKRDLHVYFLSQRTREVEPGEKIYLGKRPCPLVQVPASSRG